MNPATRTAVLVDGGPGRRKPPHKELPALLTGPNRDNCLPESQISNEIPWLWQKATEGTGRGFGLFSESLKLLSTPLWAGPRYLMIFQPHRHRQWTSCSFNQSKLIDPSASPGQRCTVTISTRKKRILHRMLYFNVNAMICDGLAVKPRSL